MELIASGTDIGDDLSAVMSAKDGRRMYLGMAPPPWLWVLQMSKDLIKNQEAGPAQEESRLLAQVSRVQEPGTLQLDARP